MHPMLFSVKRTHLCALAVARPVAARCGLTPARFDLMRAVAVHGEWGIPQWKLVRLLGVAAAVVSRMLGQLEKLGLVVRDRVEHDRRYKLVRLSADGEERVRSLLVAGVDFACRVVAVFGTRRSFVMKDLYRRLNRARSSLGDTAPFLHPWRREEVFDQRYRFVRLDLRDVDARTFDESPEGCAYSAARSARFRSGGQPFGAS